jgi:hypothetical protein
VKVGDPGDTAATGADLTNCSPGTWAEIYESIGNSWNPASDVNYYWFGLDEQKHVSIAVDTPSWWPSVLDSLLSLFSAEGTRRDF